MNEPWDLIGRVTANELNRVDHFFDFAILHSVTQATIATNHVGGGEVKALISSEEEIMPFSLSTQR